MGTHERERERQLQSQPPPKRHRLTVAEAFDSGLARGYLPVEDFDALPKPVRNVIHHFMIYIPPNDYAIRPGYYGKAAFVLLLRRKSRNHWAVRFIADMMEDE